MEQPATTAPRPLPAVTPLSEPFWSATRAHELRIQRCTRCERSQFPPEISCTHCGAEAGSVEWVRASGRARLYSWTIAHPPLLPYFAERAPWPVVAVELEEGVRMVSQLLDVAPQDYEIGMELQVDFEDVDDEISLPVFRRRC